MAGAASSSSGGRSSDSRSAPSASGTQGKAPWLIFFHGAAGWPVGWAFCGLVLLLTIVIAGLTSKPPELGALFNPTTGEEKETPDITVLDAALQAREANATLYKSFDLLVAYELKDNANAKSILSLQPIVKVSTFENRLRMLPEWQQFCERTVPEQRRLCETGISFANFALPTPSSDIGGIVPDTLLFDGQGSESVPMEAAMHVLKRHNLLEALLPVDSSGEVQSDPRRLRSLFRFRIAFGTAIDAPEDQEAAVQKLIEEWEEFLREALLPILRKPVPEKDKDEDWPIHVWFDSGEVAEAEIIEDLMPDVRLMLGFFSGLTFIYMLLYTGNLLLSLAGCAILVLSALVTCVCFALISSPPQLHVLALLGACVTVGIGADILLTYTSIWLESKECVDMRSKRAEADRMLWTYQVGVIATLKTTAIALLLCLVTVASGSLSRFTAFMVPHMVVQWFCITAIIVPMCAVNDRFFPKCKNYCDCMSRKRLVSYWAVVVHKWRWIFAVTPVIVFLALGVVALVLSKFDGEGVLLIPADHNQRRGRAALASFLVPRDSFYESFKVTPEDGLVCRDDNLAQDSAGKTASGCSFLWCEVQVADPQLNLAAWSEVVITEKPVEQDRCECYEKAITRCNSQNYTMVQRFVGLSESQISSDLLSQGDLGPSEPLLSREVQTVPPLIVSNWEMGEVAMWPVTDVHSTFERDLGANTCGSHVLCFCGVQSCQRWPEWQHAATLLRTTPGSNESGEAETQARTEPVQAQKLAQVHVVLGVKAALIQKDAKVGALWQFSNRYFADLWAQRAAWAICREMPEELLIVKSSCWIEDFYFWNLDLGRRFPVPEDDFQKLSLEYISTREAAQGRDFMWIRNDEIKAWFYTFEVDVTNISTASELSAFKASWKSYASGAWVVSSLWADSMEEEESSLNTPAVLILALVIAIGGSVIAVFEPRTGCCAVVPTVCTLLGLLFFDVVLLDLEIGLIEICFVVLVAGYSAVYALRIALAYNSPAAQHFSVPCTYLGEPLPTRQHQNASFALHKAACGILGNAVFVAGCSLCLLLFCDIRFFRLTGAMTCVGVLLAALLALGLLPALLDLFGPDEGSHSFQISEIRGIAGLGFGSGNSRRQPRGQAARGNRQRGEENAGGPWDPQLFTVGQDETAAPNDIIWHGPLAVPAAPQGSGQKGQTPTSAL